MNINEQQIFEVKQQLHDQIVQYEQQLIALTAKQEQITKLEELAKSVLEYQEIQRQLADRTHVYSLLSSPQQSLRSPFVKAELFSYFEAAETVNPALVDFLVNDFLTEIRADMENGEDDVAELIETEYKEYILPGKMMAEKFDELDALCDEMVRFCKQLEPQYNEQRAADVLKYGFIAAIDADTRMEPTIHALKEVAFRYLHDTDRAELLGHVEEHLGVLRFETARKQTLAMEQAVRMMERREDKK
ncbi:MAG: hypothetical protein HYV32_06175 [Candidatus Kerfeldbacteria bacterium]|nr:hypothetical protein [Candidatus Kerfeldbacteria bacterium]